jgi:AraC family transcriptional regulator of adaptative response / DNA-3-methyladenine glycosylase II
VFAATPSRLRVARRHGAEPAAGTVTLRLPYRPPFDAAGLWAFLSARAITGVESCEAGPGAAGAPVYHRALRLAHGTGAVSLTPGAGHVSCTLRLEDLRDLGSAVQRCRRLLDLDADPEAIDAALAADPALAPMVTATPGRRLPGAVDGAEMAVRAVVGQQVSVAAARTVLARLADVHGTALTTPDGEVRRAFPTAAALAAADPSTLPMPAARQRALRGLCTAIDAGEVDLEPGADPAETAAALRALPGIGPWTADYLAMRALAVPDVFLSGDLAVRRGAVALGLPGEERALAAHAERWRPWRSYAVLHLWNAPAPDPVGPTTPTPRST